MTWFKQIIKRIFDLSASIFGLIVLSPILFSIAIWIKIGSKGSIFYRGVRIGMHGIPFRIYKFRSMIMNAETMGASSTSGDDERITRVGKILRHYKLDELPQFINVFLGEMSFVGPRPEVKKFVDTYNDEEKFILTVKPGITDWSSLQFSNEEEILKAHADRYPDADEAYAKFIRPEKLKLQLEYVRKHSMLVDLVIITKTITTVLSKVWIKDCKQQDNSFE